MVVSDWDVQPLIDYIRSLPDFEEYKTIDGNYDHIGATLADAVLQANNNYERNVRHRIDGIRKLYPTETSLGALKSA